jgi:putative intracellular protease/amidase
MSSRSGAKETCSRFQALLDENGDVIGCCHGTTALASNGTLAFWIKFPAPPPEIKSVTFVFPQTTPFEHLAIQDQ